MSEVIRVQFETTKDKLPTILATLSGEVENIATKSMADILAARAARDADRRPAPKASAAPAQQAPVKRGKASIQTALYDGIVASGAKVGDIISYPHITTIITEAGYNASSLSPVVSVFVSMGIFERHGRRGDGMVRLVKLVRPI